MENQRIAKIFSEIAQYLSMKEVAFKPQAYQKAASYLDSLSQNIRDIYNEKGVEGLEKLPTIGESMAEKIEEYLQSGKIKEYQKLREEVPVDVDTLTQVEGVGPKTVQELYQQLGIKTLEDLEQAARQQKIRELGGFGQKSEQDILEEIKFYKQHHKRFLLGRILPKAQQIRDKIQDHQAVEKASLAGSIRRMKETIGDVDVLATTPKPEKVMDFFVSLPEADKVIEEGVTKSTIRTAQGFDVDLRIVPQESYGAALQYFTGSKQHNIALRKIAISRNFKLNEYGLFRNEERVAGETEEEVYQSLGLSTPPPEIRLNEGEIEAAQNDNLPELINYSDLKGDLHCHTKWSDGLNSIRQMAEVARDQYGYQYLAITDHTKGLPVAGGLNEEELLQQMKKIDQLNEELKDIQILKGCEANIMKDGSLDIEEEILAKLDLVVAGVHDHYQMSKKEMTERILTAIKNPLVNIIAHPGGRVIQKRPPYSLDWGQVFQQAVRHNTILEINSYPSRLDLKGERIRSARSAGVKMNIDTDSHQIDHLRWAVFGIGQARRGWASKKDIVNTFDLKKLYSQLK